MRNRAHSTLTAGLLVLAFLATQAPAQLPHHSLALDIGKPNKTFKLTFPEGSTQAIDVFLEDGGDGYTCDSGYDIDLFYTDGAANDEFLVQIEGAWVASNQFTLSPTVLNMATVGTFFAQVIVDDGVSTIEWDRGTLVLEPSPFADPAVLATLSLFPFENYAGPGHTGLVASAADDAGYLAVDGTWSAAGAGDLTDLVAATNALDQDIADIEDELQDHEDDITALQAGGGAGFDTNSSFQMAADTLGGFDDMAATNAAINNGAVFLTNSWIRMLSPAGAAFPSGVSPYATIRPASSGKAGLVLDAGSTNTGDVLVLQTGTNLPFRLQGDGSIHVWNPMTFYNAQTNASVTITHTSVSVGVDSPMVIDNAGAIDSPSGAAFDGTVTVGGDVNIGEAGVQVAGLSIRGDLWVEDDGSPYEKIMRVWDSADNAVLDLHADDAITMRLHANGDSYLNGGNLGIGTDTPTAKLHVSNGVALVEGGTGAFASGGYTLKLNGTGNGAFVDFAGAGQAGISADGTVSGWDLDGVFLQRNYGTPDGPIQYAFINSDNTIRFALAQNGTGYATANPRSMLIGTGTQWGTNTVWGPYALTNAGFAAGLLDFDTGATGGDLLVEDDGAFGGDVHALGGVHPGTGVFMPNSTDLEWGAGGTAIRGYDSGSSDYLWFFVGSTPRLQISHTGNMWVTNLTGTATSTFDYVEGDGSLLTGIEAGIDTNTSFTMAAGTTVAVHRLEFEEIASDDKDFAVSNLTASTLDVAGGVTITEGALTDSMIVSADIKAGTISTSDVVVAEFSALGGGGGGTYTIGFGNLGNEAWADSQTNYVGFHKDATTTYDQQKFIIPTDGTIVGYYYRTTFAAAGSSEPMTSCLYYAGSARLGVTNRPWNSYDTDCFVSGISQAVSAGDYVAFRTESPVFTTNPSSAMKGYVVIEGD